MCHLLISRRSISDDDTLIILPKNDVSGSRCFTMKAPVVIYDCIKLGKCSDLSNHDGQIKRNFMFIFHTLSKQLFSI